MPLYLPCIKPVEAMSADELVQERRRRAILMGAMDLSSHYRERLVQNWREKRIKKLAERFGWEELP